MIKVLNKYLIEKPFEFALVLFIIAVNLPNLTKVETDPDIWGRIKFGNEIVQNHTPYIQEKYSYLIDSKSWIDTEWLSGVIYAVMFNIAHNPGLILFKAGVLFLILLNVYIVFKKFKLNNFIVFLLLSILLDVLTIGTFVIRAHLFTYFFLGLFFHLIIKYRYDNYKYLYFIPWLFPLWVNFHGGFVAAIAFLGLFVGSEITRILFFDKESNDEILKVNRLKTLINTVVLTFLMCLINPWGLKIFKAIIRFDLLNRSEISEWRPLNLLSVNALLYFIILFLAIFTFRKTRQKIFFPEFLMFIVLILIPFSAVRHLPLTAIGVLILIAPHLTSAAKNSFLNQFTGFNNVNKKMSYTLIVSGVFLLLVNLVFRIIFNLNFVYNDMPYWNMRLLKESNVKANCVNYFDWGAFLIYHLSPNIKVSIDPRRDLAYSNAIYKINLDFMLGTNQWDAILDDYKTDMVLVSKNTVSYNLIKMRPDFIYVFEDSVACLFVRKNFPQLADLQVQAIKYRALCQNAKTNDHTFP